MKTKDFFIVKNIKALDIAIISIDKNRTVCESIAYLSNNYVDKYVFSFANGGY